MVTVNVEVTAETMDEALAKLGYTPPAEEVNDDGGEVVAGAAKFGDGVLLGKLVEAFLKIWPLIAPILIGVAKDGDKPKSEPV